MRKPECLLSSRCPVRRNLWWAYGLVFASLPSCFESLSSEETFTPSPPVRETDELRGAAAAGNQFAFDLYPQLATEGDNLIFSPAGLSVTLATAKEGAAGATQQELANVLHLEAETLASAAGFGELNASLNSGGHGYRLRCANRLWGAKQYPFAAEFLKRTKSTFDADLASLDFRRPSDAADTINEWVSEQTNGKIESLVSPQSFNALTRLVLTNAVHFRGRWNLKFWTKKTEESPFHVTADRDVVVPLMYQKEHFQYVEAENTQIIELPYARDDEMSMIVILPEEIGLDRLEATLDAAKLAEWLKLLGDREVELFLPRFRTTSRLELAPALKELGLTSAFDAKQADFSAMSSEPGLFISQVVQKAYIAVDEEGTEAAAATAIVAEAAAEVSQEEPPKPAVFRADRPFLYLIRDKRTDAILFLGRLIDPTR